ncbi:MAG: hypothetical protein ACQEST_08045 [Bacteroidota bacterium]
MKPVFQALFALIIIGAIGALIISLSIDGIVKSNIEDTTSQLMETTVDVDDVSISILDGSGTIDGITIHNPDGFSDEPALKLQQISLKMKVSSLLSDTVMIEEIHIQKPELFFEQKASGSNFDALTDKMESSSSSDSNVIIDYLLVENGQITLTADIGEEQTVAAEFSRIEIEGIGRDGNNSMEQATRQILQPILEKALQEAATEGLIDKAKDALEDLLDG